MAGIGLHFVSKVRQKVQVQFETRFGGFTWSWLIRLVSLESNVCLTYYLLAPQSKWQDPIPSTRSCRQQKITS